MKDIMNDVIKDFHTIDIENCISDIEYAITDIETELAFLRRYLTNLKILVEDGQRRIDQI